MAKRIRSKKQAGFDRAALKKLFGLGIIRKPDLRKAPTKSQLRKIREFAEIVAAKKTSAKAAGLPGKRHGETIFKTKSGKILGVRKMGKRTVVSHFKSLPKDQVPARSEKKRVQYVLPFNRGRDASGQWIVEWKRWPTYEALWEFMQGDTGKNYKNWPDYVIEEQIGGETDVALREKLAEKTRRNAEKWQKEARKKKAGKRGTTQSRNSKSAGGRRSRKKKK